MNKNISFTGRRRARRYALQALYAWILNQNPLHEVEAYTLSTHQMGALDVVYFQTLLQGVASQISGLDLMIEPHLSTRKLEDLDLIERTILRMAVYELKEQKEVPYRVVINEAVELAKIFASPESHKFVNGVIDKVAKVMQ
jgi:N utilization substance protein B